MKNAFTVIVYTTILIFCVVLGTALTNGYIDSRIKKYDEKHQIETEIEHSAAPSFFNQSPEEGLVEALEYYEIQYPQIVYAQALIETGHFKSKLCTQYNNLFGLYNSRTKSHYRFDNWWDSIIAYKNKIQYKYKGNTDYYTFLINLPYATDPNYIKKIKQLEHKYDERRSTQANE